LAQALLSLVAPPGWVIAHEAPRLGAPPRATKWTLKGENPWSIAFCRSRKRAVRRNFPGARRNHAGLGAASHACHFTSLTIDSTNKGKNMSRTLKAIERHMTPPTKRQAVEPHAPKFVGEWQQRGP